MHRILPYLVIFICAASCVEPYDFEVTETAEVLVVDALFTNEVKVHQVKLSISGALNADTVKKVNGAKVQILSEDGVVIDLSESFAGTYETAANVSAQQGKSYALSIVLENGETYQSNYEMAPTAVAIDRIYGQYVERPSTETAEIFRGIQFFIDASDDTSESSNFRYEYREDYEVKVPYPSLYEWDEDTETYSGREEDIGSCYTFELSNKLIITSTAGLSENRLVEFPIRLVGREDAQLNFKYSISVKQFSITSNAYQYYKNLNENNEAAGSFFDKQKGTIPGNIQNKNNSGIPVLGFFEVSNVTEKIAFFVPDDFADQGFVPRDPLLFKCNFNDVASVTLTRFLSNEVVLGRNIFQFSFPIPDTVTLVTPQCSDCRFYGELKKPDFWD